jgi:phosphoglycolate phosphatase
MKLKNYQYLLFDLDGTLTDPKLGTVNAIIHALNYYGVTEMKLDLVDKFIGPPLIESFQKYYGFSEEESSLCVKKYREYYSETGLYENYMYEGVDKMLENLKSCGKILILATSKPEVFAKKILEHFGLLRYFDFVAGSELSGDRIHKVEVIQHALNEMGIRDISKCLMIGDRMHDILGARKAGLDCMGVLYGYGTREELEEYGADYLAEQVEDIVRILSC